MYVMDLYAVRLLHGADKPLIVFFLFPEIPESEHLSSPCISASPSFMDITSDSEPGEQSASITKSTYPHHALACRMRWCGLTTCSQVYSYLASHVAAALALQASLARPLI